jgi:hypothetical protein
MAKHSEVCHADGQHSRGLGIDYHLFGASERPYVPKDPVAATTRELHWGSPRPVASSQALPMYSAILPRGVQRLCLCRLYLKSEVPSLSHAGSLATFRCCALCWMSLSREVLDYHPRVLTIEHQIAFILYMYVGHLT